MTNQIQTKQAFTLVELSIVIVIIGLIVAGITAGKSLINSAQLRSVVSELQNYQTALNTFKMQYNALPGELTNAYSYWGASCTAGAASDCNGNGDGIIAFVGAGLSATDVESLMVWKHLQLAKLINGSYTGIGIECDNRSTQAGLNVPASARTGGGWNLSYNYTAYWTGLGTNQLTLGSKDPCWNHSNGILTPSETVNIDSKLDDGIARNGKFWANDGSDSTATSCVNGAGTSGYNIATTTKECQIAVKVN